MFGHLVEVAHDGPTAIEKATAGVPDLVLCDLGLPGMSGYDVARALRSNPDLRDARLVAVSGYAQPEDMRRAAEAGFIGHIAKPSAASSLEQYLVTR
jgi:CheY-like chemotaxis protein